MTAPRALSGFVGALLLAACARTPPPGLPPDPSGLPPARAEDTTSTAQDGPASTTGPAVHPVFHIRATALGTLRPNEPVDIVARVTADAMVDTAVFVITLPELADARRTGRDASFERRGVGEPYPSLEHVEGPMRRGTPLVLRRRVVFRAPGYYFVSLAARARTRPITDRPRPTADEAFHSFHIRIDDDGGFVSHEPDQTRSVLPQADTTIDVAQSLPLPASVAAAPHAPAYSAVVDTAAADVTGDGVPDRIELSADAELDARGRPLFEHGHRWRVIVRSRVGTFALSDDFVPSGDVRIRTEARDVDERDAPPAIVIAWRSRESWGERRVRFDATSRTFVTESVVRVTPE